MSNLSDPGGTLTVGLLGPVVAARGGRPIAIPGARPTTVLAVLAAAANRVVPITSLIDALFDDAPGENAEAAVQVYVARLRKALAEGADQGSPGPVTTWGNGYRLDLAAGAVDVEQFVSLRQKAAESLRVGDPAAARRLAGESLRLWRGPALAGLPRSHFVTDLAMSLSEQRLVAAEIHIDASMDLYRYDDAIGEARDLVRDHPYRESLTERLMLALHRSSRQAEALEVFTDLRRRLDDELGLEPGATLQDLQRRVLMRDPTLGAESLSHRRDGAPEPTERAATETGALGYLLIDGRPAIAVTRTPWTIGRNPACDLVLADTQVSRRHAHIVMHNDQPTIIDLGSTNGTRVGGSAVTSDPLYDGAQIVIGGQTIEFRRAQP
jgi:DNA-binding SARP family transcriptional activator